MSLNRRDVVSLVLIVLIPILANAPMLFGGVASDPALLVGGFSARLDWNPVKGYPTIDPNIGFISQAVGRQVANELTHGRIWWWNPFEGVGFPVGESLSAAGMFPLSILLSLNNGVAIERCVLEIATGIATWLLVRELGGSALAALVAAAAFSLNGTTTWLGTPWADTAPFLPLLILGIERLRRGAVGGWALIACALGLSIVAGFPENAYLYGLLALAWAIVRIGQSTQRVRFAAALVTSGIAGLLIAAPALVAFADYLTVAYTGGHLAGSFADVSLAAAGIPQVFLPYVWGPIFANHALDVLWGNVGGYAGVGLCALALVAVFGRSNRALRILLFGWVIVTVLATFNTPIVHSAFAHIPLVKYTAFFRYLPTSWEFALAMLAAFAIDDIRSFRTEESLLRLGLAIVVCGSVVVYAMHAGGIDLFGDPNAPFRAWIFFSLEAAILVFIGIAVAATVEGRRARTLLLAVVIIGEAVAYYLVPERSFARSGMLDWAPISYLQKNLGYQRFYTLGPIAPNYGSYFKIASINHNDLPVPNRWIDFIHKNLDPFADGIIFVGWFPVAKPGVPSRADELRANVHGYERAGVRFVVSTPDKDPFDGTFESPTGSGPQTQMPLTSTTEVNFRVSGLPTPDDLSGVEIFQSNEPGSAADGQLDIRVCDLHGSCASGSRALREASHNGFFHIDMRRRQRMNPPGFSVTIADRSSKHLETLWAYASAGDESLSVDGKTVPGKALRLRFDFASHGRRTFHDRTLSIFELPHPRPYFEAAGCRLAASARTRLEASCSAPSDLHRLELLMPGWHVAVNGERVEIGLFDEAFQSVHLPAGRSTVEFWFLPPFVEYGFGALVIALAAICTSLFVDLRMFKAVALPRKQVATVTSK